MSESKKLNLKALLDKALVKLSVLRQYSVVIFVVFVAGMYGFLLFRINTLNSTQPTADQVSVRVKAVQIPHIDEKVVQQLKSLQDNSVSVQALFNEARNNPFQQ